MAGQALPASSRGLTIASFAMVWALVYVDEAIHNGDWEMRQKKTSRSVWLPESVILQQGEARVGYGGDVGETSGLL